MNAKIVAMLGITSLATCTLMSGPFIVVQPPSVVVQVPAPPPIVVETSVPDDYVWDGSEYVGVVGSQYYYLGPDHVWLTLDAPRLARFHGWETGHADWRSHAIRNDQYRHDAHGHDVPRRDMQRHDDHAAPVVHHDADHQAPDHKAADHSAADHSHDAADHSHDHDHDNH